MVRPIPRKVVLGCVRKQDERALESKSVSSVPPQSTSVELNFSRTLSSLDDRL